MYVAHMEKWRNTQNLSRKPGRGNQLEDKGIHRRIILK
jgi:hypothetical protein